MAGSKRRIYSGNLEKMISRKIFLNISQLDEGMYELIIMYRDRKIKMVTFKRP